MGLPILTALFGIGVGFAVVELLSHVTSVPEFATQLAAMIGIGVGIDYALFIVTRYRQGLQDGLDPETSVVTALDTAGRAVLFAGTTVVISLLGMLLIGIAFVGGLGVGAAAVVAVTMVASITLLPALLGFVGRNIDKFKLPGIGKMKDPRTTAGYRWSHFLQRHPWPFAVLGLVILLGLAMPVLSHPPRLVRREQHAHHRDHPPGLRPQGRGLRRRRQRPAAARRRDQRPAATCPSLQQLARRAGGHARRRPGQPAPAQRGRRRRHHPGHPDDLVAGRGHRRHSSSTCATTCCPQATAGTDVQVHVGGITAAVRRRGHQAADPPAAVHRRGARPQLPAADGRVPLDRRARSRP